MLKLLYSDSLVLRWYLFLRLGVHGAAEGVLVYLIPKWNLLLETQTWCDACHQVFFTLSTSLGSMITVSSLKDYHHNVFLNSFTVTCLNCLTSFWVSMPVFMILGQMGLLTNVAVTKVSISDRQKLELKVKGWDIDFDRFFLFTFVCILRL